MKHLDVKNMQQLQDYAHRRYFVQLRPGETYADLFVPTFWNYHRGKLADNDLVRVRAHDGSFDVNVTVVAVNVGGVVMQRWPIEPPADDMTKAKEVGNAERYVPYGNDGKPVVRVDFLPATQWRVIGLHGEVSQGHKDEATANKAMAQYLKEIRHAMPDAEDQAKYLDGHMKRVAAEEARQQAKRERRAALGR
jgi:hypothetical protein